MSVISALQRFIMRPLNVMITLAAATGFLFSVQSKVPYFVDLSGSDSALVEGTSEQRFGVSIPISSYLGPVVVTVNHGPLPPETSMLVTAEAGIGAWGNFPADSPGSKRVILFPGELSTGGKLSIVVVSTTALPDSVIENVSFAFPRSGNWLVPDAGLWIGFVVAVLLFGFTAAQLRFSNSVTSAIFTLTGIMLMMAVFFWGLNLAERLVELAPAIATLFIAAVIYHLASHSAAIEDTKRTS